MSNEISIVGAGLAGLIAAHYFKNAKVIEAGDGSVSHQALLRFRTPDIGVLTGIPFKKVTVDKEVYFKGESFRGRCPIAAANQYSLKVTGTIANRSIRNISPVERWVAPDNFQQIMLDNIKSEGRIALNTPFDFSIRKGEKVISTAPLPVALKSAGVVDTYGPDFSFDAKEIGVVKVKLDVDSDVYQTVYFADFNDPLYRLSITGDVVIAEFNLDMITAAGWDDNFIITSAIAAVEVVLGIKGSGCVSAGKAKFYKQKLGKIKSLPDDLRHSLIYELTDKYGIYSLGRFATWRNILLDDVMNDLKKLKTLIDASEYSRRLIR